ncbi:MAG: hypothetical protein R3E09_03405 [Novosphingobium sp.]
MGRGFMPIRGVFEANDFDPDFRRQPGKIRIIASRAMINADVTPKAPLARNPRGEIVISQLSNAFISKANAGCRTVDISLYHPLPIAWL